MFAPFRGAIAQLGERLHGMQEVDGSIPSGSTRTKARSRSAVDFSSPSSRGLGHNPFTVATGVRIPVGTPLRRERSRRSPALYICEHRHTLDRPLAVLFGR